MLDAQSGLAPGALLAAVDWLQDLLLGTIATTVAVMAVASIGYLTLSGRIDLRRGATIIIGCFILFGAPSIARGFQAVAGASDGSTIPPTPQTAFTAPLPAPVKVPDTQPYDPYAGASVPKR